MEYDKDKVDEMVLAFLYLTSSRDKYAARAWKGLDWETMDRLHQKGYDGGFTPSQPPPKSMILGEVEYSPPFLFCKMGEAGGGTKFGFAVALPVTVARVTIEYRLSWYIVTIEKTCRSMTMPQSEDFWDFYWELRLLPMENLGKRAAILAASKLIRSLAQQIDHPLRLLELGCGEGQVIGTLLDAHAPLCAVQASVGVDYNAQSLARCQRDYAGFRCIEGDFTNQDLLAGLGRFEIVLLINALHEVFSDSYSLELGEIDVAVAKQNVEQALAYAAGCLEPEGWLVLFDGLEPPGDPQQMLRIRFHDEQIRQEFENFVRQYRPLRITYRQVEDPLCVELSRRDFTRYITKSIFIGKRLWDTERFESYQYFTEEEYRAAFARQGLEICELGILTMNDEKWRRQVEIVTDGVTFPDEHILILARQVGHLHLFG